MAKIGKAKVASSPKDVVYLVLLSVGVVVVVGGLIYFGSRRPAAEPAKSEWELRFGDGPVALVGYPPPARAVPAARFGELPADRAAWLESVRAQLVLDWEREDPAVAISLDLFRKPEESSAAYDALRGAEAVGGLGEAASFGAAGLVFRRGRAVTRVHPLREGSATKAALVEQAHEADAAIVRTFGATP